MPGPDIVAAVKPEGKLKSAEDWKNSAEQNFARVKDQASKYGTVYLVIKVNRVLMQKLMLWDS